MNSNEQVLNNLSVAIVSLDSELRTEWLNLSAEAMLGCSNRFAQGKKISAIVPMPQSLLEQIAEAMQTGQTMVRRRVKLISRSFGTLYIDCVVTPIEESNQISQVLLELLDVDRPLKIATERALQEQQERSQNIIRGIAHEVLNPLGGIRGAAQLLEQELGSSKLTEYTQLLIKETDRLQKLLRRMLGPNTRPILEKHNVHEMLNYVSRLLLKDNPGNVRTLYDYDPSIPDLYCDNEKLVQVLINLVSNALLALKDTTDPAVTLKTRVERNFTIRGELKRLVCKIYVQDNGPGIPESLKDNLFDPLISGRPGGTGLGLSIAQSLVAQHGGMIECSDTDHCTSFEITLPLEHHHES